MFWNDGLSQKFAPEHDFFCNIWKDDISFFQKIWYFFFVQKMKEDDLYEKNTWKYGISVHMRRSNKHDIALLAKKQRCPCPEKIHLGVAPPVSPKKMVFILENRVFFLKCYIDWHSRKGPIRSHRRCSTRKGVLRNLAKFTGKDLCWGLFFNKVTSLRPATLLKKKLRRRCFPVSFSKFLRTLLLQNTPGWLLLEFQLFSVLLWRPL